MDKNPKIAKLIKEKYEEYKYDQFQLDDGTFFRLTDTGDIVEMPDGNQDVHGGGVDVEKGLTDEQSEKIELVFANSGCDYDDFIRLANQYYIDPSIDSDDNISSTLKEYYDEIEEDDEDDDSDCLKRIYEAYEKSSFESLGEMVICGLKYGTSDTDNIYWYEGEYHYLEDDLDSGESRGEYDDLDDDEWIEILENLEDYKV